jgi:hypothetical protein
MQRLERINGLVPVSFEFYGRIMTASNHTPRETAKLIRSFRSKFRPENIKVRHFRNNVIDFIGGGKES